MGSSLVRTASPILALTGLLCSGALGQDWPGRDDRSIFSGLAEPSFVVRPHERRLEVRYSRRPPFTVDVPIDYPADYVDFAKPGLPREPERLLLAGRDAEGRGVLVWIRVEGREPAQWSVLDSFHQPASDFVGVAYSAQTQRLYLLELRSQTIYRASFSPSAEKLPTKWSALAHSSQFGDPGDLGLRALSLSRDGAEPQLWVYYVNSEMLSKVRRDTPIVIDGQHGVTFDVHADGGRRAAIGTRELRLGMQAVPLVGSPGLNAELVRLDGAQGIQVIGRAPLDDVQRRRIARRDPAPVRRGVWGAQPAQQAPLFPLPHSREALGRGSGAPRWPRHPAPALDGDGGLRGSGVLPRALLSRARGRVAARGVAARSSSHLDRRR